MGTIQSITAPTGGFEAYATFPVDEKTKGALVVVPEVWGLDDHFKDVAERFMREGYAVLVPELLDGQIIAGHAAKLKMDVFDPVKHNAARAELHELTAPLHDEAFVRRTIGRLKACFNQLADQEPTGGKVAVIGFGFGGTYAFQLAAEEPLLKAAVAFYGHAPLTGGKLGWISCPIQAFYGERDESLIRQLPAVEAAMHEASVAFETKVYADAGHAFFNDTNPQAYNQAAATDAWQRTLEFLERTVADPPELM